MWLGEKSCENYRLGISSPLPCTFVSVRNAPWQPVTQMFRRTAFLTFCNDMPLVQVPVMFFRTSPSSGFSGGNLADIRQRCAGNADVRELKIFARRITGKSLNRIIRRVAVAGADQIDAEKTAGQNIEVVARNVFNDPGAADAGLHIHAKSSGWSACNAQSAHCGCRRKFRCRCRWRQNVARSKCIR